MSSKPCPHPDLNATHLRNVVDHVRIDMQGVFVPCAEGTLVMTKTMAMIPW